MPNPNPFYLLGAWTESAKVLDVLNPYTNEIIYRVYEGDESHIEAALAGASKSFALTKALPVHKRYEILHHISRRILERKQEFSEILCAEAGKPLDFALGEVDRAAITFSLAADLVRQPVGEILPLDLSAKHEGRIGLVKYFPIGPVLAISPFNFPLNLVAHKLAPAIAAGNPIILKPASVTPVTALKLAEIIAETDWPKEALTVLPCPASLAQKMVEDDRLKMLSFTGSPKVGWYLKSVAGKKKVALELGGDAAAIIDKSADLEDAASKCAFGAFAYAGQVCISVQRILVHEEVYESFMEHFIKAVKAIKTGDPGESGTIVGPLIDAANKDRLENWIQEARDHGANILLGNGSAAGNVLSPTVLEKVAPVCHLYKDEAFGPVVNVFPVKDMETAFAQVNASRYGLQTGIFSDSQKSIRLAFETLDVGGIIVNHVPTLRVDNMPYGGIKDSGFGREGLQYAIHEQQEPKVLVW